jgi:hypothetical protein
VSAGKIRANARRRLRVIQAIDFLRRRGVVKPELLPFASLAEQELADWMRSAGGAERLSAMRRSLFEDAAFLGLLMRAEGAKYLSATDYEQASGAATRAATLSNSRRASLVAAGIDSPPPDEIPIGALIRVPHEDAPAQDASSAPIEAEAQPSAGAGDASTPSGDALGAPTANENSEKVSE